MDSASDSADRVLDYVVAHWKGLPKRPTLTEKEMAPASLILEMLNSLSEDNCDIVSEQYLLDFEDDEKDLSKMCMENGVCGRNETTPKRQDELIDLGVL
ncbi:unnamed protein product [Caenorhabditis brenneri]